LQHPRSNCGIDVLCYSTPHRARNKDEDAGDKDAIASDAIRRGAAEQHQCAQDQRVRFDDPERLRGTRV
jgi:hypothetical protein